MTTLPHRRLEIIGYSFADDSCACPTCCHLCHRHDTDTRTMIDIHLTYTVLLHVLVGVFICSQCGKCFRQDIPFAYPRFRYTKRSIAKAVLSATQDGLSLEKAIVRLNRDFGINPSSASISRWVARFPLHLVDENVPSYQDYHLRAVANFSGVLVLDEVYDNQFAVVFARDPLNNTTLGYLLTEGSVDQDKLRLFLEQLKQQGIIPEVTITDQSNLYPALLRELWSECRHQLCLFHFTKDVVDKVLDAARTIENALPKPPKRHRGRPKKRGRPRQDKHKRELKKKARKARRLLVRNFEKTRRRIQALEAKQTPRATAAAARAQSRLDDEQQALQELTQELPAFAVLRQFMNDYYQLFDPTGNSLDIAHARRAQLVNRSEYQAVPALKAILDKLADDDIFHKLTVFLEYHNLDRTTNDAERTNRDTKRRQQQQHYRLRSESSNARAIENATVLRGISATRRLLRRLPPNTEPLQANPNALQ